MTKRTASPDAHSERAPSPRLEYTHPIDLLKYRLGTALEEASELVDFTIDNFVLRYEKRDDGQTWYTSTLRDNAYYDPDKARYPKARRALALAFAAAIGISEWLRWGLQERAGTFETELRAALTDMESDAYDFPALPLYPVLKSRYARWEQNLSRVWELQAELGNVAVESRDPAEWYGALHNMLKAVQALDEALATYGSAAEDLTVDLATHYTTLVAAMDSVVDNLVKIGPRLIYAFKDHNDVQSLVEHLPHSLTQCSGSLAIRRAYDCDVGRSSREASTGLRSTLTEARHRVAKLGELVSCALGDQLPKLSTPEPQTISNRQAAQLYADLTTTKPDPSNIGKVIGNGRLATEADGRTTEAAVARLAQKTLRKRPKRKPNTTPDTTTEPEKKCTCPNCGKKTHKLIGSTKICHSCFLRAYGLDLDKLDTTRGTET